MAEIAVAIKAGTGIKLESMDPDDFSEIITARRRNLTGSLRSRCLQIETDLKA